MSITHQSTIYIRVRARSAQILIVPSNTFALNLFVTLGMLSGGIERNENRLHFLHDRTALRLT